MIKLEFTKTIKTNFERQDFEKVLEEYLKNDTERCDALLKRNFGIISLVLCDDAEIRKYNKKIRGKDASTDVLTFVYMEELLNEKNKVDGIFLSDILISIETAEKQAKEKMIPLKKEMQILFTHGVLHTFGYDHNTDEEEEEMENMSQKVLKNF